MTSKAFGELVLVTLVLGAGVSAAEADPIPIRVLTFDSLQADDQQIPNGYGGLSWSNFAVLNFDEDLATRVPANSGYLHGAITRPNVAFNLNGDVASLEAQTPFNFISAFLTPAWRNNLHVTVQGFADEQLKYSETITLHTTTDANFEAFNFLNVDRVRFRSFGGTNVVNDGDGTHFAMDNVTLAVAPTPEPASLLLLVTGIAASALRRRVSVKRHGAVE